jgi:hypothetical protein
MRLFRIAAEVLRASRRLLALCFFALLEAEEFPEA